MNKYLIIILTIVATGCSKKSESQLNLTEKQEHHINNTSIVILGTTQDAGSPQIACKKECCENLFVNSSNYRQVISLGLIDSENHKTYMFEATPDISRQMKMITRYEPKSDKEFVDGIFLTHAHIGHYTGLMYLGKEAMDAKNIPLYVMPRMKGFLANNGPWNQLISRKNVQLQEMKNEQPVSLSKIIEVTPILVPHRDEYSETVGYHIKGPKKSALFIPDIDKWEKWEKNIVDEIQKVDYAFLDAAFYSGKEINNRDISEIPHPFVIESFETFKDLNKNEKQKIIFIHFNHTNPLLNPDSKESQIVIGKGYRVGKINDVFEL
ncbi:MBL fold metallo-hydrolase [Mangrovimonas cancribranchiae]|uniref:MBL fold metallo-hydrolase n=1 Tax=Mangrovimonas cancribranchiae TaxID=3080055 RepID=A0AAU6NWF7_9FLAO